jgi:hypothetical protein
MILAAWMSPDSIRGTTLIEIDSGLCAGAG